MQMTPHTSSIQEQNQKVNISDIIMSLMGVDRLAYIKPASELGFTVFAADGTPLADFDTQNEALESILRHNLTPVRLH